MTLRRRILTALLPSIAITLGISAFFIDSTVRHDLTRTLDEKLLTRARAVGAALEVRLDGELEFDLEPSVAREFGVARGDSYFAIRTVDGRLLDSSSPDPPTLAGLAEGPSPAYRTDEGDRSDARSEQGAMRICSMKLEIVPDPDSEDLRDWRHGNPGKPDPTPASRVVWIETGVPAHELNQALEGIRATIGVGFGVLVLLLGLVPIVIVTRALGPLRTLCEQADAVGATSPELRLAEDGCDGEVRALVAALNRALDRLGTALEIQQRFTSDAAHELRSPVTAIRTRCEVSLRRPGNAESFRDAVKAIHQTSLRLGQTIEGLLALSRHDSIIPAFEDTDLAVLAREAITIHEPFAVAKDVTLSVDLPSAIPVVGSAALLRDAIAVLLENAVRFTPAIGNVHVTGNGVGWIAVEDTGPGIPAEEIPRIFQRFYQVDPSRSPHRGGTGLGLAIARAIADLHGASIVVTSTVDRGSRFELRLAERAME